jgi:hypothetical protein
LFAKHSQYSFKHMDLLQLQAFAEGSAWESCLAYSGLILITSRSYIETSDYISGFETYWNLGITCEVGSFSSSILVNIFLASNALLIDDTCLLLFYPACYVMKFRSSSYYSPLLSVKLYANEFSLNSTSDFFPSLLFLFPSIF